MKFSLLVFLTIASLATSAQTHSNFDKALADSLKGDDYGMKTYMMVILKTGPRVIEDKKVRDSLFKGHMANITKWVELGKIAVAGPFGKNDKSFRGLFILNVSTEEEAWKILNEDPTITQKIFSVEMVPWYGSAALPTYLPNHSKIQKKGF